MTWSESCYLDVLENYLLDLDFMWYSKSCLDMTPKSNKSINFEAFLDFPLNSSFHFYSRPFHFFSFHPCPQHTDLSLSLFVTLSTSLKCLRQQLNWCSYSVFFLLLPFQFLFLEWVWVRWCDMDICKGLKILWRKFIEKCRNCCSTSWCLFIINFKK